LNVNPDQDLNPRDKPMMPIAELLDRLKILPLYIIPQHGLSRCANWATRRRWRGWKNLLIKIFIRIYGVDMSLALEPDYHNFDNFNAFFTRELRPGVRPVADDPLIIACPVDGSISRIGNISDATIIQAKDHDYTLTELLAGDAELSECFRNGRFATLYLSPKDYHRVHMPVAGHLQAMTCVPGRLFPVNQPSTRNVPRLFARNERIINIFATGFGMMAVVMVGALCVGSMDTVWAGNVVPLKPRALRTCNYAQDSISLKKGQELGRFNMGSSVILLFERGRMEWLPELTDGSEVVMGQNLGRWV